MENHVTLEYWIDDGWYIGRLKGIPGVFSQGETLPALEENIREAYKLVLEESKAEIEISSSLKTKDMVVTI